MLINNIKLGQSQIKSGGSVWRLSPAPETLDEFSLAAVPAAEGYNATTTTGGRQNGSTQVIAVENLNDNGAGSLRSALQTSGDRIVIFNVSGDISLTNTALGDENAKSILITDPNVTVLGHTAPSPGITVVGQVQIRTQNVVVQHLRIRPSGSEPSDCFNVHSTASLVYLSNNSLTYAGDEAIGLTTNGTFPSGGCDNITVRYCLLQDNVGHQFLADEGTRALCGLRNIFAPSSVNTTRNPQCDEDTESVWVNNLTYNNLSTFRFAFFWNGGSVGEQYPTHASLIGNVYISSSVPTGGDEARWEINETVWSGSQFYIGDNPSIDVFFESPTPAEQVDTPPVPLPALLTILSSSEVESHLLPRIGARPLDRDSSDSALVDRIQTRSDVTSSEAQRPILANNTYVHASASDYPDNPAAIRPSGWSEIEYYAYRYARLNNYIPRAD